MPLSKIWHLGILVLLPSALLLCDQDSPLNPSATFFKMGREAIARKDAELATLFFLKARNAAAMDRGRTANANVLIVVEDALKASDPLYEAHATTTSNTSKRLLGIAKRYIDKGWSTTARPFIESATQLDSLQVANAGLLLSTDRTDKVGEIARHFPDLVGPWLLQGWSVHGGTYVAPWTKKGTASGIVSPLAHLPAYRIEVEIRIEDVSDHAGVLIAFKDLDDHKRIDVLLTKEGNRCIRLLNCKPDKPEYDEVDYVWQDPKPKQLHAWFTLVIEVRAGEVSVGADDYPLRVFQVPTDDFSGKIGLAVLSEAKTRKHVRFRNFRLRRLKK